MTEGCKGGGGDTNHIGTSGNCTGLQAAEGRSFFDNEDCRALQQKEGSKGRLH